MINLAVIDSYIGVAVHTACCDTQTLRLARHGIAVVTTTTTVHVAMPTTVAFDADGTTIDGDTGIALHVTTGCAAVHVALDVGTCIDGDM